MASLHVSSSEVSGLPDPPARVPDPYSVERYLDREVRVMMFCVFSRLRTTFGACQFSEMIMP